MDDPLQTYNKLALFQILSVKFWGYILVVTLNLLLLVSYFFGVWSFDDDER